MAPIQAHNNKEKVLQMARRRAANFAVPVDASIKLIEVDLSDIVTQFVSGKVKLPLEKTFDHPPESGLANGIMDSLESRAGKIDRESVWLRHKITMFASGEWKLSLLDSVAQRDTFVLLTVKQADYESMPAGLANAARVFGITFYEKAAQLSAAAARANGAGAVHLIQPYMIGSRADQGHDEKAATVALQAQSFEPFVSTAASLHLHAPQIPGFWRAPFFHLAAREIFIPHFLLTRPGSPDLISADKFDVAHVKELLGSTAFCSPDIGGAKPVQDYAKYTKTLAVRILAALDDRPVTAEGIAKYERLLAKDNIPIAMIDKRRDGPNRSEVFNVIGNVEGRRARMWDDIGDTLGTGAGGAKAFMAQGAKGIDLTMTHLLASGEALERLRNTPIDRVDITNSIPLRRAVKEMTVSGKPIIIPHDITPMLAQVIIDLITRPNPNLYGLRARHMPLEAAVHNEGRYLPPVMQKLGYPARLFANGLH